MKKISIIIGIIILITAAILALFVLPKNNPPETESATKDEQTLVDPLSQNLPNERVEELVTVTIERGHGSLSEATYQTTCNLDESIEQIYLHNGRTNFIIEANTNNDYPIALGTIKDLSNLMSTEEQSAMETDVCPILATRIYDSYHLLDATGLRVEVEDNESEPFLLVETIDYLLPLPPSPILPQDLLESPVQHIFDDHILYQSNYGISAFDLSSWNTWDIAKIKWDNAQGVSAFIQSPYNPPIVAFATTEWGKDPEIYVVDLYNSQSYNMTSEHPLLWQQGVSGIAELEFSEDIYFEDKDHLTISIYPVIYNMIESGQYPPDYGPDDMDVWNWETGTLMSHIDFVS